jgi:hypothetical protein
MSNKQLVKKIVDKYVEDKKAFTSLDISNDAKTNGDWIRNSQDSHELKLLFRANTYIDYKVTEIDVVRKEDGSIVTAILYLPENSCETDYTNISGSPITPDDFDSKAIVVKTDDGDDSDDNLVKDDSIIVKDDADDIQPKTIKIKNTVFTKSKRNYSRFNFR